MEALPSFYCLFNQLVIGGTATFVCLSEDMFRYASNIGSNLRINAANKNPNLRIKLPKLRAKVQQIFEIRNR